jgi:hypothetical protein
MSLNNFIPQVWTARVLRNLHKAQIWGQAGVVNRDYEGDIAAYGDTVRINAIGPVSIGTYTKNSNIGDPDTLTDAGSTLVIDQSKYFNFAIDDVDRAQQRPQVMDEAMFEAGYSISDNADQYIAGLVTGAASVNVIGTDAAPKTDTAPSSGISKAYDYLVDLGVLLSNANVPREGRWVIVPPWFHGFLQRDDRFVRYGTPQQTDVLQNGVIGKAAGFTVLESNNVLQTGTSVFNVTAGHQMAMTYANQISSVEAYRPQQRFGDAMKGLHLYGAKLVRPQAIAVLKCTDPGF